MAKEKFSHYSDGQAVWPAFIFTEAGVSVNGQHFSPLQLCGMVEGWFKSANDHGWPLIDSRGRAVSRSHEAQKIKAAVGTDEASA